jgi:hypothetical protein
MGEDMKSIKFFGTVLIMAITGCAHEAMRGSVAMKVSDDEAHVCLGDKEVKVGDKVELFKNICTSPKAARAGDAAGCRREKLGEGAVTRTLNDHYSIVKVNPGVAFEEGNIVEKE